MWPETRWLLVSLHDVAAATWPQCQRVLDAIAEVADIPLTLLLVPAYHGHCSAQPAFETEMSRLAARGHELALHGYFHTDSQLPDGWVDWLRRRVYTAGEGEFAALSQREAAERLFLGRRWFSASGWPLAGFVPPAWYSNCPSARNACQAPGPINADHPNIRRSWQRHLEHLLRDRRPATKAALIRAVSDSREPMRAPTGTSTARFPSVT